MRLIRLLIVLYVITFMTVNAQNKLTLDEAINLAYKNNIELQKLYSRITNAEINLDESSRLPNPLFSYSREDLKSNTLNYSEWITSGSIPINFLWDRWSNIESKEKALEAQKILLNHQKTIIASEVSDNYFTLFYYADLSQKINNTLVRLTELAQSVKHRLTEGDISEYELQRILIEINKLKLTASEIELQKAKYENTLKLMIGTNVSDKILTAPNNNIDLVDYVEEELIKKALDNRNDLKSFQHLIKSESLYLSHSNLKIIPNINLRAGYKEQLDNFRGTVFQVDFEIPLFNRNQKEIQQSENSLALLEREVLFLKEKIKTEVSEGYTKLVININLYKDQNEVNLENIFDTAVYSYEQGEISLIELIDGINAFIEGSRIASDIEINIQRSISELEKAVGMTHKDFNNY